MPKVSPFLESSHLEIVILAFALIVGLILAKKLDNRPKR
jgi:hypothetical protein